MENFVDHISLVLMFGVIIGAILGTWTFIGEKIVERLGLKDKLLKFMFGYDENNE